MPLLPAQARSSHGSDAPRYTGCSPTIRRLFEREQARKFSDERAADNDAQRRVPHGVAVGQKGATPLTSLTPPQQPNPATHSAPLSTHPASVSTPSPIAPTVHRLLVAANRNLKAWRDLTDDEKDVISLEEAEHLGAIACRATFSPSKERELRRLAAAGVDILQRIADAIAYQFRKRFGVVPAFGFVLEEAPGTNKLHIHGIYMPLDVPADQVREAFVTAAGKIVGQAGSTQFWHAPVEDAVRYWTYSRKREGSVLRRLGLDRVTFQSTSLRRLGRDAVERARKPIPASPAPAPIYSPALQAELDELQRQLDALDTDPVSDSQEPAGESDPISGTPAPATAQRLLAAAPGRPMESIEQIEALVGLPAPRPIACAHGPPV